MKTFRDNEGREWLVRINVTAVKHCRALVDVDIYSLVDENFQGLDKLLCDPIKLVDLLYVLCKTEADERGISDEDFGRAMGGDSLNMAAAAFLDELTDFFPDPCVRAGLKKVIDAATKAKDRLLMTMEKELDQIDIDSVVSKLIASFGTLRV